MGRYALTAPATSSRLVPLELRTVRTDDGVFVTVEGTIGVADGLEGTVPKAVEPKVLPATASVDVMGVKWPKLPVAELSLPVSEKKWIVPVSLDAHRMVELSLNARQ